MFLWLSTVEMNLWKSWLLPDLACCLSVQAKLDDVMWADVATTCVTWVLLVYCNLESVTRFSRIGVFQQRMYHSTFFFFSSFRYFQSYLSHSPHFLDWGTVPTTKASFLAAPNIKVMGPLLPEFYVAGGPLDGYEIEISLPVRHSEPSLSERWARQETRRFEFKLCIWVFFVLALILLLLLDWRPTHHPLARWWQRTTSAERTSRTMNARVLRKPLVHMDCWPTVTLWFLLSILFLDMVWWNDDAAL